MFDRRQHLRYCTEQRTWIGTIEREATSAMTLTSRQDLIQRVRDANHEIYRRVWGDSIIDWIHLDLTMAQVKLLFVLQHANRDDDEILTVGLVAQRLSIGLPAASHLVDKLVQQGLASRVEDQSDRRRALLRLTPTGSELANRLREGTRERYIRWVNLLSDGDLDALARGMSALAESAEQLEGRPDLPVSDSQTETSGCVG
jgi:MarR family transcriptional regulator, organic hydroperoxide resistance regulator